MLDILIYSPDRHILYDGNTADQVGVGGGVTARVRMSRALARLGHKVRHIGNCPRREIIHDVEYIPLDTFLPSAVDVAIVTTSGGDYDLSPYQKLPIDAEVTGIWVHGVDKPLGIEKLEYDFLLAVSGFIREKVIRTWGLPAQNIVVTHNGYEPAHFEGKHEFERDPFQLIYSSHPSKGLDAAIGICEELRRKDSRFHLEIFGGSALWGQSQGIGILPAGVTFHGLAGQIDLCEHLQKSAFSIQVQSRLEPGALSIPEAQRAGAVIVASPVGVYPELINDGINGIMVPGDPQLDEVISYAADRIIDLVKAVEDYGRIQANSIDAAVSTDQTAQQWEKVFSAKFDQFGHEPWHSQ